MSVIISDNRLFHFNIMNGSQTILILSLIRVIIIVYLRPTRESLRAKIVEQNNKQSIPKGLIELAQSYGYEAKEHTIVTDDGYIFKIFRIPASSQSPKADGKPVILIGHGLVASSDIWAFFNRSLAYVLATAGYDVWLGNARGNAYGREHKILSPDDPLFWNFSWHEIGKIDYATTIDYILKETKQQNLTFIGYSMGGTAMMVLLSERPEYNNKLKLIVNLAPCVFWKKQDPVRTTFFHVLHLFKHVMDPNGMSELLPQGSRSMRIINNMCRDYLLDFCIFSFGLLSGHDRHQYDKNELLFLTNYFPAGSSTKCFWHFCQSAKSGQFKQYDYGTENIKYYGQNDPPAYNISNIKTNMVIFYAKSDPFASKEDIEELAKQVSSDVIIESVKYDKFSHFDFVIAKDVKKMIYNRIVKVITKYVL